MPSFTGASRSSGLARTAVATVLAMVLVALCLSATTFVSASLSEFRIQYQSMMASSGKGFDMAYREMTAPPASFQWQCTSDTQGVYSVAYASQQHPYAVSISNSQLTLTRVASTPGVSYNLIGISCTYLATCSGVESGGSISFPLQEDRIVMVAGEVRSNGVANFLPVAYYVVQLSGRCLASSANVTRVFGAGAPAVWRGLWQ